jgi:hypothetical protein
VALPCPRNIFFELLGRFEGEAAGSLAVAEVDVELGLDGVPERLDEEVNGLVPVGDAVSDVV